MLVELSPTSYIAICGLVQDALLDSGDATALLMRVAQELRTATAGGMISSDLLEQPEHLEYLRRSGMAS